MRKFIKKLKSRYLGIKHNRFNMISIKGDFVNAKKSYYIFDDDEQNNLLINAKPCIYTDSKYILEDYRTYNETYLYRKGRNYKSGISLKECIKIVDKFNIPHNANVTFSTMWYIPNNSKSLEYIYFPKRKNRKKIIFNIDEPEYFNNFTEDEKMTQLVNELRNNNFIVKVYNSNPDRLIGENEGQIAIAYGYNKRIGFSTFNNSFRGYGIGCDSILWDFDDCFDKWSRSNEISKTETIENIISVLKRKENLED